MKLKLIILLLAVLSFYGCENQTTGLPGSMPQDITVEYINLEEGRTYFLSLDSSYVIYSLDGKKKKVSFTFSQPEMKMLYDSIKGKHFDMIEMYTDTVSQFPDELKIPIEEMTVTTDGKTFKKFRSYQTEIVPAFQRNFMELAALVRVLAGLAIEKEKRDFAILIDESLKPEDTFITVDMNTHYSAFDSNYFYNSSLDIPSDTMNVMALNGLNKIVISINRIDPKPGESFNIVTGTFDFDISDTLNAIRIFLENGEIKWNPAKF